MKNIFKTLLSMMLCVMFLSTVMANANTLDLQEEAEHTETSVLCECGNIMHASFKVISEGSDLYDSYYCDVCDIYVTKDFIGHEIEYQQGIEIIESNPLLKRADLCWCGGTLYALQDLMLSDTYTEMKGALPCKVGTSTKDDIWRYYYYKVSRCGSCARAYLTEKTSYYKDYGYCYREGKYELY